MTREEFLEKWFWPQCEDETEVATDIDALIAAAREEQREVDAALIDGHGFLHVVPDDDGHGHEMPAGVLIRRTALTATPQADRISDLLVEVGEAALVSEQQDKVLGELADEIKALTEQLRNRDDDAADKAKHQADRIRELEKQVAAWQEKAQVWLASPEAAKRLEGYLELGRQCAKLEKERDAALAKVNHGHRE